ncbi:MAG: helix-turn-helix domain-containing protein [Rubrivivax sp.]|nr:helix-turn-helix domain-containing protein [Rubrivivax sp.]
MSTQTRRHAFVLLPQHSLLAYSGAAEALGAANEALGEPRYEALLLSLDGQAVRAACGTRVAVHGSLASAPPLAAAHVVSQTLPAPGEAVAAEAELSRWLRAQAAAAALLGGIGNGAAWLAQAGVLSGYRATAQHEQVAALGERHAHTVFSSRVYEIDRDRLSCAAGTASIDLFIAWLGREHGEALVQALLAHFGLERLRARDERQQVRGGSRGVSAKVNEAVALMEANLEEPLPTEEIARLVGVSRRQLERLFKQHLDDMPSRHYTELRLARARRLLQHSGQSILQIALACGFASGSHFSNAYRARFGHTPRDERSQRAAAWKAHREEP